jgi:hypothetical protein
VSSDEIKIDEVTKTPLTLDQMGSIEWEKRKIFDEMNPF